MDSDDVWDDSEGDGLVREHQTRYDRHFNNGFMEGIDVGKTEAAQAGFDAGYAAGLPDGERLGRLHGQLDALQVMCAHKSSDPTLEAQVDKLSREYAAHEKRLTVAICSNIATANNASLPQGCAERLEEARVGKERWQGLEEAVGLDRGSYEHAVVLRELETQMQAVLHQALHGTPCASDGQGPPSTDRVGEG